MSHELDTTDLDAAPQAVKYAHERRNQGCRVYLVTTYDDGSQWHRTGYVGKTTGWKPGYLLMTDSRAMGSSDLLTASTWENTTVVAIQQYPGAGYYTPRTAERVMPGRNRFTEPAAA